LVSREDRITQRIMVLSDDQPHLEAARAKVREYQSAGNGARELEIWAVNGLETCLGLMDHYIDLILVNYEGRPREVAIKTIQAIRAADYFGRILLGAPPTSARSSRASSAPSASAAAPPLSLRAAGSSAASTRRGASRRSTTSGSATSTCISASPRAR